MAIKLITGVPGAGKSLMMVEEIYKRKQKTYVCGLDGDLPGIEVERLEPGFDWRELPDSSFVVIDEVHYHWPHDFKTAGNPPPQIKDLSMHRHRGFEFVIASQSPAQIHQFIKNQVTEHVHLVRRFGYRRSKMYVSNEFIQHVGKQENRDEQIWNWPVKHFANYRSSEVGEKAKIRMSGAQRKLVLVIGFLVVFVPGALAYFVFGSPMREGLSIQAGVRQGAGAMGLIDKEGAEPRPPTPGDPGVGGGGSTALIAEAEQSDQVLEQKGAGGSEKEKEVRTGVLDSWTDSKIADNVAGWSCAPTGKCRLYGRSEYEAIDQLRVRRIIDLIEYERRTIKAAPDLGGPGAKNVR